MPLSDKDGAALIAELEKLKRELEKEKETIRRENELQKRKYETKLERLQYEMELEWLQYETELEWLQSETVEMPMLPLLEGPEQSAPTTVALAAEAPAAEVMTDTRVFPDTAAPDASVERAAIKLTSAAGPSSKICGERRLFATTTAAGRSMIVTATATAAVTAVTATAAAAAATTPPATTAHGGIQSLL